MSKLSIEVVSLQTKHIKDINKTNEAFPIFGRIVPSYQDGNWSFEEELFPATTMIRFPDDRLEWNDYIDSSKKVIYLAYMGQECIGQIRIVRDWTKYGYIENIAVRQEYRMFGVGALLFKQAEQWARENKLLGLSLEAQEDNLAACRFYIRQGMLLGGVDTMKQAFNKEINLTLYWYKIFPDGNHCR